LQPHHVSAQGFTTVAISMGSGEGREGRTPLYLGGNAVGQHGWAMTGQPHLCQHKEKALHAGLLHTAKHASR
jgi:hypothetical protein